MARHDDRIVTAKFDSYSIALDEFISAAEHDDNAKSKQVHHDKQVVAFRDATT